MLTFMNQLKYAYNAEFNDGDNPLLTRVVSNDMTSNYYFEYDGVTTYVDQFTLQEYLDDEQCSYKFDGTDTDGTEWYKCIIHDELAPSDFGYCNAYQEDGYGNSSIQDKIYALNELSRCQYESLQL